MELLGEAPDQTIIMAGTVGVLGCANPRSSRGQPQGIALRASQIVWSDIIRKNSTYFFTKLAQIVTLLAWLLKQPIIHSSPFHYSNYQIMTTTLQRVERQNVWQQFCEWITSTNNRLYIGWFGVLMVPTLLSATI
ncbi:MAG: hypothetical protein NW224_28330, partial [Leptolyngbyaceae cyanobacterium bins.302]|nr:hypothetical protein [Leptolyngbyaceae cyanobacterium bins.302]